MEPGSEMIHNFICAGSDGKKRKDYNICMGIYQDMVYRFLLIKPGSDIERVFCSYLLFYIDPGQDSGVFAGRFGSVHHINMYG
jgi:hypothetical protein